MNQRIPGEDIGKAKKKAKRLETYKMTDVKRQTPRNFVSSNATQDKLKKFSSLLKNMKYTESQTNQNSNKFGKRPKIKKNPNFRNFDHVRSSQNGYNEENNP